MAGEAAVAAEGVGGALGYLKICADGRGACFARFCAEKMLLLQPVYLYTGCSNSSFLHVFCMA